MIQILLEGFLLGLATGHLCIATCGPVYAPYLMQKEQGGVGGALKVVLFISIGRFVAYGFFGLAAGALGAQISEVNRTWFTIISYILLSMMLLNTAFVTRQTNHALCAVSKWGKVTTNPIMLGIITGINFCPSFLIALTDAVHLSGPLSGLILFSAFFVGTNVFLIPFSLFGVLGSKQLFRKIALVASVFVAVFFTIRAGMMLYEELMPDRRQIISIMDQQTPLYIITMQPQFFEALATELRSTHAKKVIVCEAMPTTTGVVYILVDYRLGEPYAQKLKKAERFVILLPAKIENPAEIPHFLKEYHFFFDEKHGSYFSMSQKIK